MSDERNPKDIVGATKCPLRFVPPALDIVAAPAMEHGAIKYGPYNWREKKISLMLYLEATRRHLLAMIDGEDAEPETGILHLSSIAANAAIIADAQFGGHLIDDRPSKGPAADMMRQMKAVPTPGGIPSAPVGDEKF